jgi:hypothetical protein
MIKWDIYKAKSWMLRTGMDHIRDGLFAEGGELVFEAKWGEGCDNERKFRFTLKNICEWEDEDIEEAIREAMK